MTGEHILVVEDDTNLRTALEDNLRDEGYDVTGVGDVAAAREALESGSPDVVILDIMLPDGDGYTLCRHLRAQRVGARVLMLTARTLEDDVLRGFDAGADDYLVKPYRLRELLARVRALARRGGVATEARAEPFGEWRLDAEKRTVTDESGTPLELTRTEFDVLRCLLAGRDRALSREELLREAWGGVHVEVRTVDNFISSLKKKLRWSPSSSWRIRTVRGYGYRMEVEDASASVDRP